MINWTATKLEIINISEICDRAITPGIKQSKFDLLMDIEATHCNGCPLDLDKLLNFDDFNFSHDVVGIINHIDRDTGKLKNCFLPRCSR